MYYLDLGIVAYIENSISESKRSKAKAQYYVYLIYLQHVICTNLNIDIHLFAKS